MEKLGILYDSFSGYGKKELEALGFSYINMTSIIDGKPYKDGIELELKDKAGFELIKNAKEIKTSMPAIGLIVEKMEKMSKKFENVIFFAMNKGFSSTYSTSVAASKNFKNIHVISNKLISTSMIDAGKQAIDMANKNKSMDEIFAMFQAWADNSYSFVIPATAAPIIKSGRLTGVKKLTFEKLKLIPGLLIIEDGFSLSTIKRNFGKVIKSSVEKIVTKIGKDNVNDYIWEVIHTGNEVNKNKVISAFKEVGVKKISENWASLTITSHTGIGSVGISVRKINNK